MHLIHETLARAQIRSRVESARERRLGAQLRRIRRLNRRAEEANSAARLEEQRLW